MNPQFHARLKLTWVRQTDKHHIYSIRFPGQARASVVAIPKFGQPTRYPNASYCLPTTKPPKELIVEISEIGSSVE
jgi:hypothetical protein